MIHDPFVYSKTPRCQRDAAEKQTDKNDAHSSCCAHGNCPLLQSAGNLAAAEAPRTNVYMTGGAVNNSLDTFYIGFPCPVTASVGVAHFNTKSYTLIAKFTLSPLLHLLACAQLLTSLNSVYYNNRCFHKLQAYFQGYFQLSGEYFKKMI